MNPHASTNTRKKIGLIGGLAERAGIFYYEQLVARHKANGEPAQVMLNHADVDTVLAFVGANDRDGLGIYLGRLADELSAGGAGLVAITAVAPHLAIAETSPLTRAPIVDVLPTIAPGVQAAGFDRVAIFGNGAVVGSNVFGALRDDAVVPLAPSLRERVHAIYTDIALNGKRATREESDALAGIARTLIDEGGAQAIVLAGTDLSSFYADHRPAYPFVDVAQLHIDAIMDASR